MTPNLNDAVAGYAAAWSADEPTRRRILEEIWALDGLYCDPIGRAQGREEFIAHMGRAQELFPEHRIETSSGVDEHDGHFRFSWVLVNPLDEIVIEGVDYGVVDDTGQIKTLIGFFGP